MATIILIDVDNLWRKTYGIYLERKLGHDVKGFSSVEEAIPELKKESPDLVIFYDNYAFPEVKTDVVEGIKKVREVVQSKIMVGTDSGRPESYEKFERMGCEVLHFNSMPDHPKPLVAITKALEKSESIITKMGKELNG